MPTQYVPILQFGEIGPVYSGLKVDREKEKEKRN